MTTSTDESKGASRPPAAAAPVFVLPRQKSRSRERRESRMYLVDGQLCWADSSEQAGSFGGIGSKRNSSMGLLFGSSMDLSGMSMGHSIDSSGGAGSGSEEATAYRIKWCRENIMQLKRQTWPMERKLQVLKASKLFIKQHQGELKQSKQAKDVIASTSAIFERYWRHFKREFANFIVIITPWEMRIKKIESHFGSVVASYFTFLRWIFWLNLANSLVMVTFVMVPELIENAPDLTGMRKGELGMEQPMGPDGRPLERPEFNPRLSELWDFEGFLKFSPIFYGYYSNLEISRSGFWRNPLAFLLSAILIYLFCFFCISRKLSQNTKLSRIGTKDDEYTFCWTVFVGWDFMIGNSETAYNKTSSLVMNLKEGILEEKEQTKDRDWRLFIRRVFANLITSVLIVASSYVVTLAVARSENLPEDASFLQKQELQLVMSGIQFAFPPLFDVIGYIEKYHPRKALSWQLGRILFLDFLNFYALMFSLFKQVDQMGTQLNEVSGNITLFRKNTTYWQDLFTTTTTTTTTISTLSPELATSSSTPQTGTDLASSISTAKDNNITTTTMNSNITSSSFSSMNATTIQPQFVSTVWPAITLDPLSSSAPGAGSSSANATTSAGAILTSVLLASSTIMPSQTVISSFSGPKAAVDVAPTSPAPISTTTTGVLLPATGLPPMTSPSTSSIEPFTLAPEVTQSSTRATTSTNQPPDQELEQDYPDLGEVLGRTQQPIGGRSVREVLSRKKMKRRRLSKTLYLVRPEIESDTEINGETVIQFEQHQTERDGSLRDGDDSNHLRAAETRVYDGAFIPPIQDPYNKQNRRKHRPKVHPAREPVTQPSSGHYFDDQEEENEEEEEEEPLEGRLLSGGGNSRKVQSTKRPIASHGIARPIGGIGQQRGSRVQMTRPPSLDDDSNEDIVGGSTQISTSDAGQTSSSPELVAATELVNGESSTTSTSGSDTTSDTLPTSPVANESFGLAEGKSALSPPAGEEAAKEQVNPRGPETVSANEQQTSPAATTTCIPQFSVVESSTELRFANGSTLMSSFKTDPFNASEVSYTDCIEIPEFKHQEILALNETFKEKLKSLCWETMFGQEMVKMVVMDLVMTVMSAVTLEFMRACFVRYCNRFFFWDLERKFPGYQDFKIAENVLHLVNNQSTVWMGMFFAPGLPAINTVKLAVLMYVRSWAVLTCNIPHETVFKVSKSNNFYYWILLINLLICILPVAYAVTWIRPSWHCGPFGGECRMYLVVTKVVKSLLPPSANQAFRYVSSPGAVIPILISLILIIYYLASTLSSSKEANKELKAQLKKDKEQEAAVPEITNTTVVDSAPATSAPAATPSASSVPATAASSSLAPTSGGATTQISGLAAPSGHQPPPSEGAPSQLPARAESRPKSLLMPPPP